MLKTFVAATLAAFFTFAPTMAQADPMSRHHGHERMWRHHHHDMHMMRKMHRHDMHRHDMRHIRRHPMHGPAPM